VAIQSPAEIDARLEREVDDALVARWNRDRSFAGVRHMVGVMWAIRSFDMASALRSLPVPALVVFGGSGPTLECRPAVEEVLCAGARIEVLAGAGHFVTIDQPDAFAALVGDFLAVPGG
jgi:pimeloyl-ACP methyl ester carboxylesterase